MVTLQDFIHRLKSSNHVDVEKTHIFMFWFPCSGLSGLYVAETLLRKKKETSVCVFEKESRFGGRILDHCFSEAPDVAVGKMSKYHYKFAFC